MRPTLAYPPMAENYKVSAAHVLAALGCVLLVGQLYTWIGFFSHPITSASPTGPYSAKTYWGARYFEAQSILTVVFILWIVIKRCAQEQRFTFDAKFCIAAILTYWCDPLVEFFEPIFFNSAYLVNVHDWTPFIPFMVNPDAGTTLEAPVMIGCTYLGGFLAYAMLLNAVMKRAETRFPGISMAWLYLVAFVFGIAIEVVMEVLWLKLELISYPGAPDFLAIHSGNGKMPFPEWFTAGFVFSTFSCVRYFVNEKGQRITERGLERHSPKGQAVISTIAMVAILNGLLILASLTDAVIGLYSTPYPNVPSHLVNGACDLPGSSVTTRYGPCPGSTGFRMPLQGSLDRPNPRTGQ